MLPPAFTSSYRLLKSCWLGKRLASSLIRQGQSKERSGVLKVVTPFKHLSLEYTKYLTCINSDENRESVWRSENPVPLQFTFGLCVRICCLFLWAIWQASKQAAQRAAGSSSQRRERRYPGVLYSQRICLWFRNSLIHAKAQEGSSCWH